MTDSPFYNYGFTYEYKGKEYSFVIIANNEEEAIGRAKAMGNIKFEGEMIPSV